MRGLFGSISYGIQEWVGLVRSRQEVCRSCFGICCLSLAMRTYVMAFGTTLITKTSLLCCGLSEAERESGSWDIIGVMCGTVLLVKEVT